MGVIICSTHGRQPIRLTCEHLAARKPGPEAFRDAVRHTDPEFDMEWWYCPACSDQYRGVSPCEDKSESPGVPVCSLCYPVPD